MEDEYYKLEQSRGWHSLFQRLHQTAKQQAGSQTEAKRPTNIPRNRYRDVLPIDETRVKLNDECDYINANYVKDDEVGRSYILTQGPLSHTCSHFWQMVWEQNSKGILMLNKCVERAMNKCYPYWPQGIDEPIVEFEPFRIELISSEDFYSYRLSHLRLENINTEESRVILHFHYTRWPDFGVPKTADDFLDFLEAVRKSGVLNEDVGPCIVHCSAGIGRSGTFCLVDICLKKIEKSDGDLNSVDLQSTLLEMRKQRLGLIQTPDQLRFSYVAILQKAYNDMDSGSETDDHNQLENVTSDSEDIEEDEEVSSLSNGMNRPSIDVYNISQFESDAPPPLPPRPPDLLRDLSPSPPPPPTLPPPGPPIYTTNDTEEIVLVQYDRETSNTEQDNDIEDNQWYLNGGQQFPPVPVNNVVEPDDDDTPPPPPPRKESTLNKRHRSASPTVTMVTNVGGDSFLVSGGGEGSPPMGRVPYLGRHQSLGVKDGRSNSFEERALIRELNELEKLVEKKQQLKVIPDEDEIKINESVELRRRQRTERQIRLQNKINEMQSNLRTQETRDSTLPWLLVGVAIVAVGYLVYCYYTKT